MSFSKQFQKYSFPNLGFIRLPEIVISNTIRKDLSLDDKANNKLILRTLCYKGFEEKLLKGQIPKEDHQKYTDQIKFELDFFDKYYFTDYVLLCYLVIRKAVELGVFIDFGRGSCVSSAVFWLLKITRCDPLKHNLFFSRFVSETRTKSKVINGEVYLDKSLIPDADLNLGEGRDKIVDWLRELYPNRVCKILALATMSGKVLIKDVYKTYAEVSEDQSQAIADLVEREFGVVQDIEDVYKDNEQFKQWADDNTEVYNIALSLRDLNHHTTVHASGHIISHDELSETMPTQLDSEKQLISSYTMDDAPAVKLDLLNITTNRILKEVFSKIEEDVESINLDDDPIIYDQFQSGNLLPYGLYQVSANCMYRVANHIKPKNILDLSHCSAIARPGSLAYEKPFVKNNSESPHPLFTKTLEWTRFQPLYQEQTLAMAVAIGFTPDEAEQLRRIIGRKKLEEIGEWEQKIKDKVKTNKLPAEVGDILWKLANESASYSFNFCLSPDTVVETQVGNKMMFEVNIGDKVKAYDVKNNKDHFVKIINKYENNVDIHEVELEDGRKIKCSLNHKFLCEDGKMRPLRKILITKSKIVTD